MKTLLSPKNLAWSAALAASFAAGYFFKGAANENSTSQTAASAPPAAASPDRQSKSFANAQKKAVEGNVSPAANEAHLQQAKQANRYNRILELVEKGGIKLSGAGFSNDFRANQPVIELFDLSQADQEKLELAEKNALEAIKSWELSHSTLIKSDDTGITYEFPAGPTFAAEAKAHFSQAAQDVLGADGVSLMSGSINELYADLYLKRVVTFSIEKLSYGQDIYTINTNQFSADGILQGGELSRGGRIDKTHHTSVQARYSHLFQVQDPD